MRKISEALKKEHAKIHKKNYYNKPDKKYNAYKRSADKRGIAWNISLQEFCETLNHRCIYCGTEENMGVDRINNDIGYQKNNCLPACGPCNMARGKRTVKKFIEDSRRITNYFVPNDLILAGDFCD